MKPSLYIILLFHQLFAFGQVTERFDFIEKFSSYHLKEVEEENYTSDEYQEARSEFYRKVHEVINNKDSIISEYYKLLFQFETKEIEAYINEFSSKEISKENLIIKLISWKNESDGSYDTAYYIQHLFDKLKILLETRKDDDVFSILLMEDELEQILELINKLKT